MSLRGTFKTNRKAEIDGVTIPVGINEHNGNEITITVSRMSRSNKRYTKAIEERTRPHSAAISNETLDTEIGDKILREVFVDTVLLGFSNLPKSELTGNPDDKEELEFTRENALALFDELPDMYDDWEGRAKKSSTFRDTEREKSAGN